MSRYNPTKHTNLRRRTSTGEYVLFAKISGKLFVEGLDTLIEDVALERRDRRATEIRRAMGLVESAGAPIEDSTTRECLNAWMAVMKTETPVMLTQRYNVEVLKALAGHLPKLDESVRNLTEGDLLAWSKAFQAKYSTSRYNGAVGLLKRMFRWAVERGLRSDNPAAKIKRLRQRSKIPQLPTMTQFRQIVAHVRASGHRFSQDSADMIEFMAYSGCRKTESWGVLISDLDFSRYDGQGGIYVREVKGLTRGAKPRWVPMNPDMRRLLDRMRVKWKPGQKRVLRVRECQISLTSACAKVECARFTHHALRHLFATRAIESGIDILTVSKWLGHQDGGALAMKTYAHLLDSHSAAMAQKMSFEPAVPIAVNHRMGWIPPETSARFIPSGIKNIQRVAATGEFVFYGRIGGEPKRVPLDTWDAEEAKKKAAEIALAAQSSPAEV